MAKLIRMCPYCRSRELIRFGTYRYEGRTRARYMCKVCDKSTIYPLVKLVAERKKGKKE